MPLFSQTGGTAVELRLVGFPCRSHPRELPPVLRLPPGVADQNHKDFSAKNRSHKKNQIADTIKAGPTTRPGSASRTPDASQKAGESTPRNSQTVSLFSNAALKEPRDAPPARPDTSGKPQRTPATPRSPPG